MTQEVYRQILERAQDLPVKENEPLYSEIELLICCIVVAMIAGGLGFLLGFVQCLF